MFDKTVFCKKKERNSKPHLVGKDDQNHLTQPISLPSLTSPMIFSFTFFALSARHSLPVRADVHIPARTFALKEARLLRVAYGNRIAVMQGVVLAGVSACEGK